MLVRQKVIVSAPKSCIDQWNEAVLDTLNVRSKRVLATNELRNITPRSLKKHDVIIVSRDVVASAFKHCHTWVTEHHRNERGQWCAAWDRTPGTCLHPLLDTQFSIAFIDELVCFCKEFSNRFAAFAFSHFANASIVQHHSTT